MIDQRVPPGPLARLRQKQHVYAYNMIRMRLCSHAFVALIFIISYGYHPQSMTLLLGVAWGCTQLGAHTFHYTVPDKLDRVCSNYMKAICCDVLIYLEYIYTFPHFGLFAAVSCAKVYNVTGSTNLHN